MINIFEKRIEKELQWTKAMLVKSLAFFDFWTCVENQSSPNKQKLNEMPNVVTQSKLKQLLQLLPINETVEVAMNKMISLRRHPAFETIIGLNGTINWSCDPSFKSIREWLYYFAIQIFQLVQSLVNVHECSKYIAIFEADKLAKKLEHNIHVEFEPSFVENVMNLFMESSKVADTRTVNYDLVEDTIKETIFDDCDSELFHEFTHSMCKDNSVGALASVIEIHRVLQNTFTQQLLELLASKVHYAEFFRLLEATYSEFNASSEVHIRTIYKNHVTCIPIVALEPSVIFRKHAADFVENVIGAEYGKSGLFKLTLHEESTYEQLKFPEFSVAFPGSSELLLWDDFKAWLTANQLDKFEPKTIAPYDSSLPIRDPNYRLVFPKSVVFLKYCTFFVENKSALIPHYYVKELRDRLNTALDTLYADEVGIDTVDFTGFMTVKDEWEKRYELIAKEFDVDELTTAGYYIKKLFPKFSWILDLSKTVNPDNMNSSLRRLAMFLEFPKAAILLHNQQKCHSLCKQENTSYCLLDLVMDGSAEHLKRCEIPLDSEIVQAIRKTYEEEEDEARQKVNSGAHYLNALKCLLFPKTFENIPSELRQQLEDPTSLFFFDDFKKLISKHMRYFLPVEEKMYSRSWVQMMDSISNIVSSSTVHLLSECEDVHVACYETIDPRLLRIMFPSYLYQKLNPFIEYKEPLSKLIFRFGLDKLASCIRNHKLLDCDVKKNLQNYHDLLVQCREYHKDCTDHHASSYEELIDFIFGNHVYPLKVKIVEKLEELIMNLSNEELRLKTIRDIAADCCMIRRYINMVPKMVLVEPSLEYIERPTTDPMPEPRHLWQHIQTDSVDQDEDKLMFCQDLETTRSICMKYNGTFDAKNHQSLADIEDDEERFYYVDSKDAMSIFQEASLKLPELMSLARHITSSKSYGYYSCTPFMSPSRILCKPSHIILREFFNFLNYELNIFRSIRDECISHLQKYINYFCERFKFAFIAKFCISISAFNEVLEEGRALFSTMMRDEVCQMYVPKSDDLKKHGPDFVVTNLMMNVIPGICLGYDLAVQCLLVHLPVSNSNTNWFKLADEGMYRTFILSNPLLCGLVHSQQQCDRDWNICPLKLVNHSIEPCHLSLKKGVFMNFDRAFMNTHQDKLPWKTRERFYMPPSMRRRLMKQNDVKDREATKPVKKTKNTKLPNSQKFENREAGRAVRASSKGQEEDAQTTVDSKPSTSRSVSSTSSSSSVVVRTAQPEPAQIHKDVKIKPTDTVKLDVLLLNLNMLKTILKLILDKDTYPRVINRKIFKQLENKECFDWRRVVGIMENVRSLIPNFDNVLVQIKSIRLVAGSAILFKTGTCIDWLNPNDLTRSRNNTKTHDLKQDWIKALPYAELFYPNDTDQELFEILMKHLSDKLAASIGKSEIVTLKCPQEDLHKMMYELKLKLKMEGSEETRKFVEERKKELIGVEDEKVVKILQILAFGECEDQLSKNFGEVLMRQVKVCNGDKNKKQRMIEQVLYKIKKSERILGALVSEDVDKYGITRKYHKKQMTHVPIVRSILNGASVFEEDVKFALDVALLLENDKYQSSKVADQPDMVQTFNYLSKMEVDEMCQNMGFETISFEILEETLPISNPKVPTLSPNYTLCITAAAFLDEILTILTELKVFESLDAKNIDTLTIFIDHLMGYLKPEKSGTFCIDYAQAQLFLEETRRKFKGFSAEKHRPKNSNKKEMTDATTDKRFLSSFRAILLSMKNANMSEKELIQMTDIRTLLFEYHELGVAYHNQKMCCQDGKLGYCPLDYIDKSGTDYEIPEKCNYTSTESITKFQRKMVEFNIRRLSKCVVRDSKNKLQRKKLNPAKETTKETTGVSISTQTEVTLAFYATIQQEKESLQSDVRNLNNVIFDLRREMENVKTSGEVQLSKIKVDAERRERNLRKRLEESLKANERIVKEAEEDMKEQKMLTEEWKGRYKKVIGSSNASTSMEEYVESEATVEYFMEYIEKGTNLIEEAEDQLKQFLSISDVNSDKRRAKIEMENFKIKTESLIRSAQFNLELLEGDEEVVMEEFLKLAPLPRPFSQQTDQKMASAQERRNDEENPKCNICDQKLSTKIFKCRYCTYRCDFDCFETWALSNPSCPQCRRKDENFIRKQYEDQFPAVM